MNVNLIDFDGKIPNLALMKASAYFKQYGDSVSLNANEGHFDIVFCSVLFSWNREKADMLHAINPDIIFGGTGWNIKTTLPKEIEVCKPDYDLYTADFLYPRIKGIMKQATKMDKAHALVDAGIGFTSRGCIRKCGFCVVPEKEGDLHPDTDIKNIINPRSKNIILLDNNILADPNALEKLHELRDRKLTVDFTQGLDIRLMTPELAKALSEIKHMRSLHYAWDLIQSEQQVFRGIDVLSKFVSRSRHMCFCLAGYNTTPEEDDYRFRKLTEAKVDPYIMVYNHAGDLRLKHWARWVNGRIYKVCSFNEYGPWAKHKEQLQLAL